MDKNFFSADDLADLSKDLEIMQESEIKDDKANEEDDPEVDASKRRFEEIIKKHKGGK